MVHILQRMQVLSSQSTRFAIAVLRCMAPVGQTVTQAASSHCWHIIGTVMPSRSHVYACTREAAGRNWLSCSNEQASSQLRHPVHLSGWIIRTFAMASPLAMGARDETV